MKALTLSAIALSMFAALAVHADEPGGHHPPRSQQPPQYQYPPQQGGEYGQGGYGQGGFEQGYGQGGYDQGYAQGGYAQGGFAQGGFAQGGIYQQDPMAPRGPVPAPYPIDQTYFCPPTGCGQRFAPPILPYPAPQLRPVPFPYGGGYWGGWCNVVPVGPNMYQIVVHNRFGQLPVYTGVGMNVQCVLDNYRRSGLCRGYNW